MIEEELDNVGENDEACDFFYASNTYKGRKLSEVKEGEIVGICSVIQSHWPGLLFVGQTTKKMLILFLKE